MSTEAIDSSLVNNANNSSTSPTMTSKKKRPDQQLYIPKVIKRVEPHTSTSSTTSTLKDSYSRPFSKGPSPLATRKISNTSDAGSDQSRDTNSTIKSKDYGQRMMDNHQLSRASFYRVRHFYWKNDFML